MNAPRTNRQRFHAEHVSVDEGYFVSRASIANDVLNLLDEYKKEKVCGFLPFKKCWDKLCMINLHFVSVDNDAREGYMKEVYGHFIKFIVIYSGSFEEDSDGLCYKIGALYGLYVLYHTQPLRKIKISAMPIVWNAIGLLSDYARDKGIKDLFYVCYCMLVNQVMELVIYEPICDELVYLMKNIYISGKFPTRQELYLIPRAKIKKEQEEQMERHVNTVLKNSDLLETINGLEKIALGEDDNFEQYNRDLNAAGLNHDEISSKFKTSLKNLIDDLKPEMSIMEDDAYVSPAVSQGQESIADQLFHMISAEPSPPDTPSPEQLHPDDNRMVEDIFARLEGLINNPEPELFSEVVGQSDATPQTEEQDHFNDFLTKDWEYF